MFDPQSKRDVYEEIRGRSRVKTTASDWLEALLYGSNYAKAVMSLMPGNYSDTSFTGIGDVIASMGEELYRLNESEEASVTDASINTVRDRFIGGRFGDYVGFDHWYLEGKIGAEKYRSVIKSLIKAYLAGSTAESISEAVKEILEIDITIEDASLGYAGDDALKRANTLMAQFFVDRAGTGILASYGDVMELLMALTPGHKIVKLYAVFEDSIFKADCVGIRSYGQLRDGQLPAYVYDSKPMPDGITRMSVKRMLIVKNGSPDSGVMDEWFTSYRYSGLVTRNDVGDGNWISLTTISGSHTIRARVNEGTIYYVADGSTYRATYSEFMSMLVMGGTVLVDALEVPGYVRLNGDHPWSDDLGKEDYLCNHLNCWSTWFQEYSVKETIGGRPFSHMPKIPQSEYSKNEGCAAPVIGQGCRVSDLGRRSALVTEYENLRNDCSGGSLSRVSFEVSIPNFDFTSPDYAVEIALSITTDETSYLNFGYVKVPGTTQKFVDANCVVHERVEDPVLPVGLDGNLIDPKSIALRSSGVNIVGGVSSVTKEPRMGLAFVPFAGSTLFIAYEAADVNISAYEEHFSGRSWGAHRNDVMPTAIDINATLTATARGSLDAITVNFARTPMYAGDGINMATVNDVTVWYIDGLGSRHIIKDAVQDVYPIIGSVVLNFVPVPEVNYVVGYYSSSAERDVELIAGDLGMALGICSENTGNVNIVAYPGSGWSNVRGVNQVGWAYKGFVLDGSSVLGSSMAGSIGKPISANGKIVVTDEYEVMGSIGLKSVTEDAFRDPGLSPSEWFDEGTVPFVKTFSDSGIHGTTSGLVVIPEVDYAVDVLLSMKVPGGIAWTPMRTLEETLRDAEISVPSITVKATSVSVSVPGSCQDTVRELVVFVDSKISFAIQSVEASGHPYSVARYDVGSDKLTLVPVGTSPDIVPGAHLVIYGQADAPISIGRYSGVEYREFNNDVGNSTSIVCEDPNGLSFGVSYSETYFPSREMRTNDYLDYLEWTRGDVLFEGLATPVVSSQLPVGSTIYGNMPADATGRIVRLTATSGTVSQSDVSRPAPIGPDLVGCDFFISISGERFAVVAVATASVTSSGTTYEASYCVLDRSPGPGSSAYDYSMRKVYRGTVSTHKGSTSVLVHGVDVAFLGKGAQFSVSSKNVPLHFVGMGPNGSFLYETAGYWPIADGSVLAAVDASGSIMGRFEVGSVEDIGTGLRVYLFPDSKNKANPPQTAFSWDSVIGERYRVLSVESGKILRLDRRFSAESGDYQFVAYNDRVEDVKVLLNDVNRRISIPWSILFNKPFGKELVMESHFQDPDPDPYPSTIDNPFKPNVTPGAAIRYSDTVDYRVDGIDSPGYATDFERLRGRLGYVIGGDAVTNAEASNAALAIMQDADVNPYNYIESGKGELDLGIVRGQEYVNEGAGSLLPGILDAVEDYTSPDWKMRPRYGREEAMYRVMWRNWDQHHNAVSMGTIQEMLPPGFDDNGERVHILYWNRGINDYQSMVFSGALIITRELVQRNVSYGNCPPNALIPLEDKWVLDPISLSHYDVYTANIYQVDPMGGRKVTCISELYYVGSDIPRSFVVGDDDFINGMGTPIATHSGDVRAIDVGDSTQYIINTAMPENYRVLINVSFGVPSVVGDISVARFEMLSGSVVAYDGSVLQEWLPPVNVVVDGGATVIHDGPPPSPQERQPLVMSFIGYVDATGFVSITLKNRSSLPLGHMFTVSDISLYAY